MVGYVEKGTCAAKKQCGLPQTVRAQRFLVLRPLWSWRWVSVGRVDTAGRAFGDGVPSLWHFGGVCACYSVVTGARTAVTRCSRALEDAEAQSDRLLLEELEWRMPSRKR
ncbi:hypothetical protein NDU88_010281 [Pleurodeles waltl]|uniref:Uncharacterized protein n=1 Tax=Pleurodeles waltl TaxID=8319 RepID=A0AAV7S060_PLEWA|nr:hypothetical protein NDU88_010281 [Pleurodeles waltl]